MSRSTTPIKRLRFLAKRAIGDTISILETLAYSLSTSWLKFTEALAISDIVDTLHSYVPVRYLYETLTISANSLWAWVSRRVESALNITDSLLYGITDVDTSVTIGDNTEEIGFITDGDSITLGDTVTFLAKLIESVIDITEEKWYQLSTATTATLSDVIDKLGMSLDDSIDLSDAVVFIAKLPESTLNVVRTYSSYGISHAKTSLGVSDAIDLINWFRDGAIDLADGFKATLGGIGDTLNITVGDRLLGVSDTPTSISVSDGIDKSGWGRQSSVGTADDMDCRTRCDGGCDVCDTCEQCNVACYQCDAVCYSCFTCIACATCNIACVTCEQCDTACFSCFSCNVTCYSCEKCNIGCYKCDTCDVSCYTCEDCHAGCYDCDACEGTCYSCDTCNISCYKCYNCEVCDACQNCDIACYSCDSCEGTCYTCDRCNTVCDKCDTCDVSCYTCEDCYSSCYDCNTCEGSCYSCDRCDTACYHCDNCEVCVSCQECNASCYSCNTCEGSCYSCDRCDTGCYSCATCDSSCYSCQRCNKSCYSCVSCEREYSG